MICLNQPTVRLYQTYKDHTIHISKYKPLRGSSYTKLPKELVNPKKV